MGVTFAVKEDHVRVNVEKKASKRSKVFLKSMYTFSGMIVT